MTPQITTLIQRLREELQQYGEMLALLDHHPARHSGAGRDDDPWICVSCLNAQSLAVQAARELRQAAERELVKAIQGSHDTPFSDLIPRLPEPYAVLVDALMRENRELIFRVRQRAEENQARLRHSADLLQQFLDRLGFPTAANLLDSKITRLQNDGPEDALYAAMV